MNKLEQLSIKSHIPYFLNFCEKRGLSEKTVENYYRYLTKFLLWLRENKKENIKPSELSVPDLVDYVNFINSSESLKTNSKNYYLIGLRALLGYFQAIDVVCHSPGKITLPRAFNAGKVVNYLTEDQVNDLLNAPDTKTVGGLRDILIIEVLIKSGLRINQIVALNRAYLTSHVGDSLVDISRRYLSARTDNNEALFVNFNSPNIDLKNNRLTPRSIERRLSYYGKQVGIPFPVTTELLRWGRHLGLLNQKILIRNPVKHKLVLQDVYKIPFNAKTHSVSQFGIIFYL